MKYRLMTLVSILVLLLMLGSSVALAAPPSQEETSYVVEAGDSLWKLAEEYLGNGALYPAIVSATNEQHETDSSYANITDPGVIQVGWKLLIPAEAPEAEAAAPEPAEAPEQMPGEAEIVVDGLQYPEGPFWSAQDDTLYFVEWSGDTIWTLKDGQAEVVLELEPGDGPSGLYQDADGDLWVTLYSSLKVVEIDPSTGEILQTFDNYQGGPFLGPNDLVVDAQGGVYFTDSGNFEEDWTEGRAVGAVYYITPEGELLQVDSELVYPNGIFITVDGEGLMVDEHRQNRILKYGINADGTWSDPEVFFEPDDAYLGDAEYSYELGPDGMWRDSQGNLWVAHYGGGKVLMISPEGELLGQIELPQGIYPTNTTLSPDEKTLYVTEGGDGLLYRIPAEIPTAVTIPEQMADESDIVVDGLQFPEGPFWSAMDDTLYFVEWGGDTIWTLKDGEAEVMLELEPGDGPSGLYQDADGDLWVTLYSSLKVVEMDPSSGEILRTFDNYQGQPFRGPNDLVVDAGGGVYFTDSGNFEEDWTEGRAVGAVYYITPEGELLQVDSELVYPNGIFISVDGGSLMVDEHRQNRILKYAINSDGMLSDPEVFVELEDNYLGDAEYSYELGPDGMWRDSQGNLWVAHYGGGEILVISPEGELLEKILLPQGIYPTNTTLSPDEKTLYVTEGGDGLLYQIALE